MFLLLFCFTQKLKALLHYSDSQKNTVMSQSLSNPLFTYLFYPSLQMMPESTPEK